MVAMGLVSPSFNYWRNNNPYSFIVVIATSKIVLLKHFFAKLSEVKTCMIDNDKCSSKHQDGLPWFWFIPDLEQ